MTAPTLEQIEQRIAQGPFAPSWDSLESYTVPDWYVNGKFGIFIHWGVYAVPAFDNEWYPHQMYLVGNKVYEHHRAKYGPQDKFGYKDFIPQFRAEHFDPVGWAKLFREAGARFVMPVAEHHDGFQMYASSLSRWNAAEMGPKRDVLADLADAVRAEDMVLGVSSHRAEHWWYMNGGNNFESDVQDPEYADLYGPASGTRRPSDWHCDNPPDEAFCRDWLLRCCEFIETYRPQMVFFDWWIQHMAFKPWLKKFAAYYYNSGAQWNLGVAINSKWDAYPAGTSVLDIERGQVERIHGLFWQSDTSVSRNSWGYIEGHDYKVAGDIINDLVDVVSKNGALLLNVGPRADGTIPETEQNMLREIGAWMSVNGECIYDTRPWREFGEGPTKVPEGSFADTKRDPYTSEDIRFTTKRDELFAIVMKWPENGEVRIRSLAGETVETASVLGQDAPVSCESEPESLKVDLKACRSTEGPLALKMRLPT
ncbi:MAG: alpha-L-fucosidase [Phycisphaeraceae bacterium]|nr:alpha-L-fucosidase [Phycisphaeraceae bacterium]